MPKVSKAGRKPVKTQPGAPPKQKDAPDKYYCARCGRPYIRQKANFHASQSPLFRESGYLPVCKNCVENLFDHYKEVLGSGEAAMERICLKFDIYWNPEIWGMVKKVNTTNSRVGQYVGKTFLIRYLGKTYDDTLDERGGAFGAKLLDDFVEKQIEESENVEGESEASGDGEQAVAPAPVEITAETVLFWGSGYDVQTYRELNLRYERWTADLEKPLPAADEALYKQISILEMLITRSAAVGDDVSKLQNTLNSLLGSLRLKPSQTKKDDDSSDLETTPLGVWAKRWEDQRPIPDDDVPDSKIALAITKWFYGHLGKAFGLNNVYTKLYDEAMDKYRVEKPELSDDDDDDVIVDIFGTADGSASKDGGFDE